MVLTDVQNICFRILEVFDGILDHFLPASLLHLLDG